MKSRAMRACARSISGRLPVGERPELLRVESLSAGYGGA